MKTIELDPNSTVVKLYMFFRGADRGDFQTYRESFARNMARKFEDSCHLNQWFMWKSAWTLLKAFIVFNVALFYGTGMWTTLYAIYLKVNYSVKWEDLFENDYQGAAANFFVITFSAVIILALVITAVYLITEKFIPWVQKKLEQRRQARAEQGLSEAPAKPSALKELYLSWKDKYCSRLEYVPEWKRSKETLVVDNIVDEVLVELDKLPSQTGDQDDTGTT